MSCSRLVSGTRVPGEVHRIHPAVVREVRPRKLSIGFLSNLRHAQVVLRTSGKAHACPRGVDIAQRGTAVFYELIEHFKHEL